MKILLSQQVFKAILEKGLSANHPKLTDFEKISTALACAVLEKWLYFSGNVKVRVSSDDKYFFQDNFQLFLNAFFNPIFRYTFWYKRNLLTAIDNKIINLWPEKVAPKSEKVSRKKLKSEKVFIV